MFLINPKEHLLFEFLILSLSDDVLNGKKLLIGHSLTAESDWIIMSKLYIRFQKPMMYVLDCQRQVDHDNIEILCCV